MDDLMGAVARGWCAPENAHKEMDVDLATAIAREVREVVEVEREKHRMQLAGISTASIGYWKEGDSIHPDYNTPALRDVAKLYAKYAELYAMARPLD